MNDRISVSRHAFRDVAMVAGLVVGIGLCLWVVQKVQKPFAFRTQFDRTRVAIWSLQHRRPANVSLQEWDVAFVWATRIHCEAFFSPFDTDLVAMQGFG